MEKRIRVCDLMHKGVISCYPEDTAKEIALICASHSGTDDHAAVARSIQAKASVEESELLCGVHEPLDAAIL
jgi:L-asparaginase II